MNVQGVKGCVEVWQNSFKNSTWVTKTDNVGVLRGETENDGYTVLRGAEEKSTKETMVIRYGKVRNEPYDAKALGS